MRSQQEVNILDISFHDFVDICEMRYGFSGLVDDEARAPFVWEVFNAFRGHYFAEFDMSILFGHLGQVHVDQSAELVAVLVEMQDHEGFRVCFSHFSNVFIS